MALYSNRQYHQSLHHSSCRSHTSSYHDTRNPHHSPLLLQSMACPRCSRSRRPRNARPKAAVGCGSSRLLSRSPTLCSYPCHTSGRPHSQYRCHNLLLLLCKHCLCDNSYPHRRRDPCSNHQLSRSRNPDSCLFHTPAPFRSPYPDHSRPLQFHSGAMDDFDSMNRRHYRSVRFLDYGQAYLSRKCPSRKAPSHPLLYLDGYQLHLRLQLPWRTHGDARADAAPGQGADDHGADAALGGQGAGDHVGQGHLSMIALFLGRKSCGS